MIDYKIILSQDSFLLLSWQVWLFFLIFSRCFFIKSVNCSEGESCGALLVVVNAVLLVFVVRGETVLWLSCFLDELIWHYLLDFNGVVWSVGKDFPFEAVLFGVELNSVEWILSGLPQGYESLVVGWSALCDDFPETVQVLIVVVCIHGNDPVMVVEHDSLACGKFGQQFFGKISQDVSFVVLVDKFHCVNNVDFTSDWWKGSHVVCWAWCDDGQSLIT